MKKIKRINAPCPHCGKPLVVKLLPDWGCNLWCRRCGLPLSDKRLSSIGLRQDLIDRINRWGTRTRNLLELDPVSKGLPDEEQFLRSYRVLQADTLNLIEELEPRIKVHKAFERFYRIYLDDQQAISWLRNSLRDSLIGALGFQLGARSGSKRQYPSAYPRECVTPADQKTFRTLFRLGAHVGTFDPGLVKKITNRFAQLKVRARSR